MLIVDAVLTCNKLAATEQNKKVETAYEEIGGMAGSLLVGAGVGLAIASMATPVGWLGAIIISAGKAYAGKFVGQALIGGIHKNRGDFLDLKDGRIINSWCK